MLKNFLILFLFLFKYEICQDFDPDSMKAIACISLLKKMENKNLDQHLISGYMLSCFINIDDTKAQKIISNQFSSGMGLEQDEIDRLTDFSGIQNKYTQDQIMDFSKKLNSVLETLKEQQNMGMGMSPNKGGKSKSSKKRSESSESSGGLFQFMINGIIGLFNPNDSFLFLIGFFVLVYFGLKSLRKLFVGKKNTNDKKEKKK